MATKSIHMKKGLFLVCLLICSYATLAVVSYAPTSSSSMSASVGYCRNATASAITFTFSTCHAGVGSLVGVSDTIRWYKNSTNSTSGGTLVATTIATCATSSTGTASYTPSTSTIGVTYYYCKITWPGSGVCNGTGALTSSTTTMVTVRPPATAISGSPSVCTGQSIVCTDSTVGGTWSGSNSAVATVSPAGIVTGVSAGTVEISYNTGCGTPAVMGLTVNTATAPITGRSTICFHADTASLDSTTLRNSTAGGTWSSSNSSIASINATAGLVTGLDTGSVYVTYTKSYTVGICASVAPLTVITVPYPVISGTTNVCLGAEATLGASGYFGAGGHWLSANPSIVIIDNHGVDSGNSVGSTTIFYTATNTCGNSTIATGVTVLPLPLVDTVTGYNMLCAGGTTTLADTTVGGTWSSSDVSIATVDGAGVVTGVAAGSADITYAMTTSFCGSDYNTLTVYVQAPNAGIITGPSSVATGSTITLSDSVAGGTWHSNNSSIATIGLTSGVLLGTGAGYDTVSYTIANSCGTISVNTVVHVFDIQWIGGATGHQNEWQTASNWSSGSVPSTSNAVIIPGTATYMPTLATGDTVFVGSLVVDSGVTVTLNSGSLLNVSGDLNNSGSISGAGKLSLSGNVRQALVGHGTVDNMVLANAAGAMVASASSVTVNKHISVTQGTFYTNDSLILHSDSLGNAYVGALPDSGASIAGKVIVQQYITGGRRAYRFWSHPFDSSISLAQLTQSIDISGTGGRTNGFTTTATNTPSAYRYTPYSGNSSIPYDPGWKAFTSAYGTPDSNELHKHQGIRVYYRGAKGEGLSLGSYTISATTISMMGNLNQGNQTVVLSKGSSSLQDYNMIGNPYAAPVDIGTALFNAYSAGQINTPYIYIWNPFLGVAGQFQAFTITTGGSTPEAIPYYLQPNEAFQARAAFDGAVIHFSEANKTDSISSAYSLLKRADQYLSLNIYDNNYHLYDLLNIHFDENATDSADNQLDAGKLYGSDFNFYSISAGGGKLAVDARKYESGKSIPLGVMSNHAQEFIIRAEHFNAPSGAEVYLHDKLLDTVVPLVAGTEYHFSVTESAKTQGDSRFEINLGAAKTQSLPVSVPMTVNLLPNPATEEVKINFANAGTGDINVNVTDVLGASVFSKTITANQSNGSVALSLKDLASGMYVVELKQGQQKVVQKLVKE